MELKPASVAKISRPVPTGIYPRKRLFRLLDGARKRPVVWVSGAPGSGKTTLVSSYIHAWEVPCLWYQADEGDADVATFFYYMGLAAKKASPGRKKPLPLLTPEYLPRISVFTHRFFESLYGRFRDGCVIVLDNYQKVPAGSPFHEVVREGLSRLPPGVNVIVISRGDPPPAFARLRANHLMEAIDSRELRLTREETEGITRLVRKGKRIDEPLRRLMGRMDGWAAGVVLLLEKAGIGGIDPRGMSRHTPEEIFDYFAGEIFDKAEEETKAFLLASAFLPRMTARTAERQTGHSRAGQILSSLNRNNYFTEKKQNPEPVYEYHSLFREFLFSQAESTFPREEISRIRRRAATILAESGQAEDAAGLFRECGDWEGLMRVIRSQAGSLLKQGRSQTLEEWLCSIPMETLEADPWMRYWMGASLLSTRPAESRPHFEEALRVFRARRDAEGVYLAWSGAVESIIYGFEGLTPLDPWFPLVDELLREYGAFPTEEIAARVTCSMVRALALRCPPYPAREAWARRALSVAQTSADASLRIESLVNLACYRLGGHELQELDSILESLKELLKHADAPPLARLTVGWVEAAHANLNSRYDRCLKVVSDSLDLAAETGVHLMDYLLLGQGALCSLNAGEVATAQQYLRKMASLLSLARPWEAAFYHHIAAWEALSRGDAAQASPHSERSVRLSEGVGNPWPLLVAHLDRAFVFHAFGETGKAAEHLSAARKIGAASGNEYPRFACLLSEAYFSQESGKEESALTALREGLRLGREKGFVNLYMWRPGILERVAAMAIVEGIEVPYVQELIRRNSLVPEVGLGEIEDWPWPMRVHTLGRFELVRDGKPDRHSRKVQQKPLLMLKALVALGGKDVAEEQLTDILWPETDGDLAHLSFATNLLRLRRLLGNDKAVQLREGRLTLDQRYCWVDALAFERIHRQADAGRKDGGTVRVRTLARAIALYRGHFLAGEASQPWIAPLRERLQGRFLQAVGDLGRHWESAGSWEKAIDCYRRCLEVDGLAEEIRRRLMACQKRLDRA
ncbi:MAG: hypothetical protein HZA60_01210 [Deltaproteobacteria bacterium]|nr:hypothetical protein [Deltaproteobacteria bacterium]